MNIKIFSDYAKLTPQTAVYPREFEEEYLFLGYISEVGEFCGKLKKIIRDTDLTNKSLTKEILDDIGKEIGDILWYLSQYYNLQITKRFNSFKSITDYDMNKSIPIKIELMKRDTKISKLLVFNKALTKRRKELFSIQYFDNFIYVLDLLSAFVSNILEEKLSDIAEENINKLLDRKKRNKIKGSGDKR